jgi:hypothetical protein
MLKKTLPIFLSLFCLSCSKIINNLPGTTTTLAKEPFHFETQFPIAPGLKLAHDNKRNDQYYYNCELQFHGKNDFRSLVAFYREKLASFGLQEFRYAETESSASFYFNGWPDQKLVSINIIDHSLMPEYPSMIYKKTDHPSMQYRSVTATISKRKK